MIIKNLLQSIPAETTVFNLPKTITGREAREIGGKQIIYDDKLATISEFCLDPTLGWWEPKNGLYSDDKIYAIKIKVHSQPTKTISISFPTTLTLCERKI